MMEMREQRAGEHEAVLVSHDAGGGSAMRGRQRAARVRCGRAAAVVKEAFGAGVEDATRDGVGGVKRRHHAKARGEECEASALHARTRDTGRRCRRARHRGAADRVKAGC